MTPTRKTLCPFCGAYSIRSCELEEETGGVCILLMLVVIAVIYLLVSGHYQRSINARQLEFNAAVVERLELEMPQ